MKKLPPIEKVYEAWTAITDGRIQLHDNQATVSSSDDSKEYTVRFDGNRYASDDNATYWQGYPGYPVIAVMMLKGILPFDKEEAEKWKGVNWKAVNTKFKNKYAEAVKAVAEERGINMDEARKAAENVMEKLSHLDIEIKRKL